MGFNNVVVCDASTSKLEMLRQVPGWTTMGASLPAPPPALAIALQLACHSYESSECVASQHKRWQRKLATDSERTLMGYAEPLSVVVGAPPFSALKFTYADGVMVLLFTRTDHNRRD